MRKEQVKNKMSLSLSLFFFPFFSEHRKSLVLTIALRGRPFSKGQTLSNKQRENCIYFCSYIGRPALRPGDPPRSELFQSGDIDADAGSQLCHARPNSEAEYRSCCNLAVHSLTNIAGVQPSHHLFDRTNSDLVRRFPSDIAIPAIQCVSWSESIGFTWKPL
jgi:hypothetical protein